MHQNSAFTLIEILVSVAVSSILAALAISNFNQYKQKAYDTVAMTATRDAMSSLYTSVATGKKYPVSGTIIDFHGPWGSTRSGDIKNINDEEILPGFPLNWPTELTIYVAANIDAAGFLTMNLEAGASHCRGSNTENRTSVFVIDSNTNILHKVTGSSYRGSYYKSRIGFAPNGQDC